MDFIGHMEIEQKSNQYSKKNPMEHFVWEEQKMILFALPSNIAIVSSSTLTIASSFLLYIIVYNRSVLSRFLKDKHTF